MNVTRPTPDERWSSTVVLGNGETALIRPIRPSDAAALAAFHRRQSPESTYRRFFSPKPQLTDADLEHFTVVDFVDRVALVVERYGEFIAWASYERWAGRDDADAAFQVDDAHHGKGIATLLLEHLAVIARSNGVVRFTAEVLADNRPMLAVFSRAGWPVERRFESGVVDLDFSLDDTEEFLDSVERREQRADSRAMARLLLPRTIAVVGASDEPGSIGDALWRHVTAAATGAVFPVNPHHDEIGGKRSWRRLQDVPGDVNLAVVAVPAPALPAVVEDCIEARVRGAVIITSIEGTDIDMAPLVTRARSFGVRLIGPGSMGVASPRESVGVQAMLVPADLPPGGVAISLQSGSLGASLLRLADDLHMGLSWFVSLGDKSDVSGNDLLQFWEDDDATKVVAMYTESFGNPRKFARIARRVSRRRPIVAVRTGAAAIGASGGALYQQAGLIEVPTVAAMLDTARVLATQPVMRGPRVALLANAGSPATLSRAALHTAGLEAVDGPIRLDWRSTPEDYGAALGAALADDGVDGVLIVHAPPLASAVTAPVAAIEAAAAAATKPIVTVLMGGRNGPLQPGSSLPAFAFPEQAAGVLGRSHLYGAWLADEADAPLADVGDIDRASAHDVITAALARGDDVLGVEDVVTVLGAYGIVAPTTRHGPATDAAAIADSIGYPVAGEGAAPPPRAFGARRRRPRPRRRRGRRGRGARDARGPRRRRRRGRRPADGRPGARPADPQHARRPPRTAGGDRHRQLHRRPRHRRGVTAGPAVVGERHRPARRLPCRPGAAPGDAAVGAGRRAADARRPARQRPRRHRSTRPEPDHRVQRGGRRDRRRGPRPRPAPRRRPSAPVGVTVGVEGRLDGIRDHDARARHRRPPVPSPTRG